MHVRFVLSIWLSLCSQRVFLQEFDYEDDENRNCSVSEVIKGGHVTYSQEGLPGSVLTYHCDPGQFPSPVSSRLCGSNGEWSPMRSATGRPTSRAVCKDIMCPGQLQLDNGDLWPRNQWFRVGANQSFSCREGFVLHGSLERNCTLSGHWTGRTPICDNHENDCGDPGIPPGAERSGGQFLLGEKVTYRCQAGLSLLGSGQRVCMEHREWSGSAPRCQGPNTFDTPSSVAAALAGSLAGRLDLLSPEFKKKEEEVSFGRLILVDVVSNIHVYILLDTSGSIKRKDFELATAATVALIRKLDSYDIQLKFHVVSFATEATMVVDILETEISGKADEVVHQLRTFNPESHGKKTGTNLNAALQNVLDRMTHLEINKISNFNETQNIIIIETDGYSNTGANPQIALAKIRQLLGYDNSFPDHTRERLLDVYVFGVGDQVNKQQLNMLASRKSGEDHCFVLQDYNKLGEVFNSIISDKSVTMCGIAQEEVIKTDKDDPVESNSRPWHVILKSPEWGISKYCSGSILSERWVLTAAHCFTTFSGGHVPQVSIKHGGGEASSIKVIIHPNFNIHALKHKNVSEFYDYDVALVQINNPLSLSFLARPICLPCTVPASRAMRKINSTCAEHRQELLSHSETTAFFIHKMSERKQTHIHTGSQRRACVERARKTLKEPSNVTIDEYVSERFLCTGGSTGHQDAISCKGDSGGSLFLQKRKRYFQVGVLSWGVMDMCSRTLSTRPPPEARDFHIDIFKITPWLKKNIGADVQFLPDVPLS